MSRDGYVTGAELRRRLARMAPPNEFRRFFEEARREAKCRACGSPIPRGAGHLCFRHWDGAWRKSFRLCGACLGKASREAGKRGAPKSDKEVTA